MPFKQMQTSKFPPRLWSIIGYPGSGKSTFAAQMRGPLLVVDADHRFTEVAALAGDVLELSAIGSDNTDADRISTLLNENMPGSRVGTIVVDSLTAIIAPLVTQAIIDKEQGREKNLFAGFREKALAMRQLQDAVTRWGTDVLWIYHLQDSLDAHGNELRKATVSATEIIRLTRSINMQIELVEEKGHRAAKIVWARRGRSGATLWDETGAWKEMPERIEAASYDGLTAADMDKIELSAPEVFASPEVAIAWGVDQGAFENIQHSRNAYEKLKRERQPTSAREMASLWVADVQRRVEENKSEAA